MDMYQDFIRWLSAIEEPVFIEAEAIVSRMNSFISDYNSKYTPRINRNSDGVCSLGNVDKWGVELRIYLNNISGMPEYWLNRKYRNKLYHKDEFSYRIDDNSLINALFAQGFRLGHN